MNQADRLVLIAIMVGCVALLVTMSVARIGAVGRSPSVDAVVKAQTALGDERGISSPAGARVTRGTTAGAPIQ